MPLRFLILGGTGEARKFCEKAHQKGFDCINSLAGRTDNPLLPDGKTRIGSFGGAEGLADYIMQHKIDCLIDATHPFAKKISENAVKAAAISNCPTFRLERKEWQEEEGDNWHHVSSLEEAILAVPHQARVFVTIGRQKLHLFLPRTDLTLITRTIEEPDFDLPENWTLLKKRPPYELEDEIALFKNNRIDVLITKNAGGNETRAKLLAARHFNKPVIMIKRLKKPDVETFHNLDDLLNRLQTL